MQLSKMKVPGAVERTGGICPFERKLRSWDCLIGDILTADKNIMSVFENIQILFMTLY